MIRFFCECGRQLVAQPLHVGKKAKCPSCNKVQAVPTAEEAAKMKAPVARVRQPGDPPSSMAMRKTGKLGQREPNAAAEEDVLVPEPSVRSGRALVSMILGFLSIVTLGLASIPGLILGFLALRDISNDEDALHGRGLALTGILTSVLGVLMIPVWVALWIYASSSAAVANDQRARDQDAENLKKIAKAMIDFTEHHKGHLPQAAAFRDKSGTPLLSWRVAILPFLGEDALYRKFKLEEPWNSPSNQELLAKMPAVFRRPGHPDNLNTRTFYQVFVGNGSLFDHTKEKYQAPILPPGVPTPPAFGYLYPTNIPDGLDRTILIGTSRTSVPWTQPSDLDYDFATIPPLGGYLNNRFNVAMADGSVITLPQNVNMTTLRKMITKGGNDEVEIPAIK